jgi:hypothetical protein
MPATLEKKPMAKKQVTDSVVIEVQHAERPSGYVPQFLSMALTEREGIVLQMINSYDNANDVRVRDTSDSDHVGNKLAKSMKRIINKIGDELGLQ